MGKWTIDVRRQIDLSLVLLLFFGRGAVVEEMQDGSEVEVRLVRKNAFAGPRGGVGVRDGLGEVEVLEGAAGELGEP